MTNDIKTPVWKFLSKLSIFLHKCGIDPLSDSPAEKEIKFFSRPESVQTAFSMASQSFIAANDYFKALDTLVAQKNYSIAPWSCARGMMEASAICTWLFDPEIDPKERVSRSLSIRYASLREQIKMARYDGDNEMIQKIEDRIECIERIAVSLGFELVRDRNNRRIGIGQKKPNITSLVENQFKGEKLYRIFSGMAHSNYTTLTSLSFTRTDLERKSGAVIVEAVPTTIQSSLVSQAATIYAKCLWLKTIQFGFDAAKTAVLLEEFYDGLKLPDKNESRFWRTIIKTDS